MSWNNEILTNSFDDVPICLLTYCCPCVTYGMDAQKVHGGDCVMHALKYYLYACFCGCGLVAGPTRYQLRSKYGLPQKPDCLAGTGDANTDCIVHTVPCVACFAHCQEYAELNTRGVTIDAPIAPADFTWGPLPATPVPATPAPGPTVTIQAPQQEAAPQK